MFKLSGIHFLKQKWFKIFLNKPVQNRAPYIKDLGHTGWIFFTYAYVISLNAQVGFVFSGDR